MAPRQRGERVKRSRSNPALAAEVLQLKNRARRPDAQRLAAIVVAVALVGLFSLRVDPRLGAWLALLSSQWPLVIALTVLYAAASVAKRGRRLTAEQSRAWLASAPISRSSAQLTLALRILAPLALQLASAVGFVLALALGGDAWDAGVRIAACLSGGGLIGAAAGWLSARRKRKPQYEASRYALHASTAGSLVPSTAPLSRWPIAQSFAWGRPENLRTLIVVCLLLGVQAGSSAMHGLLVVAAWLVAGYLGGALAAVPHAAREAARWLRSAPLEFSQFAWALTRRALVHQAIGSIVAGGALSALGSPLVSTLYLMALWLCVVIVVYALGVGAAYRGRPAKIEITLTLAAMAAIESRATAWSIPAALVFAAWRLKGARIS